MSPAMTAYAVIKRAGWTGLLDGTQFNFVKGILQMAGVGKRFDFHGSFSSKAEAVKKEQETGGFIRERKVKGKTRWFVLTVRN